jgi:toxin ParE1/3/4
VLRLVFLMGSYRLSERADKQIEEIFLYGVEAFGVYQAEAYHSGLKRTFELLADFPLMGPRADLFAPGMHRFRFQSHFIFYVPNTDHIFIRAILPTRMDIRPDLFE